MRGLWEFVTNNPIVLFIVAAWVLGGIGNVVKSRADARRRRERAEQRGTQSTSGSASTMATRGPDPVQRSEPRPSMQASPTPRTSTQSRSPDDVAAEMRRLLGLDPVADTAPPRARSQPQPQPVSQTRRAEPPPVPQPKSGPQPISPEAATRMFGTRIDPHVGESISSRSSAYQGRVGKHDRAWGSLGGRHMEREPVMPLAGSGPVPAGVDRLVDLQDIKRVILGAEILGPPLALRDPDQQRLV